MGGRIVVKRSRAVETGSSLRPRPDFSCVSTHVDEADRASPAPLRMHYRCRGTVCYGSREANEASGNGLSILRVRNPGHAGPYDVDEGASDGRRVASARVQPRHGRHTPAMEFNGWSLK